MGTFKTYKFYPSLMESPKINNQTIPKKEYRWDEDRFGNLVVLYRYPEAQYSNLVIPSNNSAPHQKADQTDSFPGNI